MFRTFSNAVYLFQGAVFTVVVGMNLLDYRAAVEGSFVSVDELEELTKSSNAGSVCVLGRIENCFIFLCGILLLIIGNYVKPQERAIPSLGVAFGFLVTAHSEFAISTNTFSVQVYQGEFAKLLGTFAYLNGTFGILHLLVSVGTFAGWAKQSAGESIKKKD